jgi:enoyl-CoA hydratase/carnithine racemase
MLVTREDAGGIATLTLNRPEKLNAITPALMADLRQHLERIAADASVRCVILSGAGRSFCAGHDLSAIASGEQAPSKHFEPETIDALENLPQPTIAKIHGHCFTGGLELALGCDLLVASEAAQLGDTHGQWGLAPIWGMSVRLPERVGPSRAKELMFTSRRITGAEAAALGLVDRACPEAELDGVVSALAGEIVANSAGTNRIDKALVRDATRMARNEALLRERELPYGLPEDIAERMRAPSKKPRAERDPSR